MAEVEFFVPAIHCAHCVHTIKMELQELNGVQGVEADVTSKKVRVKYEAPASPESIAKLLEEINYPPQRI
ncbi:MAG: heavy-metal-associated domain-containing protein [Thermanaerothrix sp.]|jgi:copper chaperone CopZ|uniref:Heavy metal-associated domain-containing protein n=1 Tax=Thermanaerothrix solaris TaxID=3058434 RepID=A0ABU3NIX1_9CHLR|nr:heavy metal-associated domain-containing protein [Thermanaerothrix sp. 4228-RoL]MDT8896804.1 heavy metal-associated domain-containing protein [Thermanaerothrix sp. 4228-RoL]